jgi:predicted HicB family RNase H-like nuclease
MIEYKGYIATIEFDDEADIFHGEVVNLVDIITFQGKSTEELREAFKDSVEDYLEFCASRNELPDKPFSGKLSLRISPELHRQIALKAKLKKKSLNSLISETLETATI